MCIVIFFSLQFNGERSVCTSTQEGKAAGQHVQTAEPEQYHAGRALCQKDRDGGVWRGTHPGSAL